MDLKDLRYFCTVAELEHVTRAAEKLNIAQPYLTRVIHQIEADVGGELFCKTSRRLKLNSYGKVFYNYAKRVLADVELLYSEMDYLFDRKDNTITLAMNTESFAALLMQAFNELNPDYSLSILQIKSQEMLDALIDGEIQFALCSPLLSALGMPDVIETVPVLDVVGCTLWPSGHPKLQKEAITVEDMRNENLVTMPKGSGMRNRIQPVFDRFAIHPKIVCESDNLNAITQAVKSGYGFAILTEIIMADYPELWDNVRRINLPDVVGHYGLSYDKHTIVGRNGKHFRDFILHFFEDLQKKTDDARPDCLKV